MFLKKTDQNNVE